MPWFVRENKGIVTPTELKRETPDGLWYKCPECRNVILTKVHRANAFTCPQCSYHEHIGSDDYFSILFDGAWEEISANLQSGDPLEFVDTKKYPDRLKASIAKTGLNDAVKVASGTLAAEKAVIGCMDFSFIGGSMGSVVGEKVARGIAEARRLNCPFIMISRSGGARMMEAGFSLMQMAKTSAQLALLAEAGLPFVSILTDPTTGGVTASFAMLGDFNMAEPGALIGFAGPRVVRETIGKDLPKGFQSAEFVLEHGFLDAIVDRKEMKDTLAKLLRMVKKSSDRDSTK
jgi:acetyl-CoA carboxylase carboxyl transferase subunit beta